VRAVCVCGAIKAPSVVKMAGESLWSGGGFCNSHCTRVCELIALECFCLAALDIVVIVTGCLYLHSVFGCLTLIAFAICIIGAARITWLFMVNLSLNAASERNILEFNCINSLYSAFRISALLLHGYVSL